MYEVMDTRMRLFLWPLFFFCAQLSVFFRNNLNQKSFSTYEVQRHKIFNLFSTQVPKCLCGKPKLDEISVCMKEFFYIIRRIKKMCGKLFSSSNTCFQLLPHPLECLRLFSKMKIFTSEGWKKSNYMKMLENLKLKFVLRLWKLHMCAVVDFNLI